MTTTRRPQLHMLLPGCQLSMVLSTVFYQRLVIFPTVMVNPWQGFPHRLVDQGFLVFEINGQDLGFVILSRICVSSFCVFFLLKSLCNALEARFKITPFFSVISRMVFNVQYFAKFALQIHLCEKSWVELCRSRRDCQTSIHHMCSTLVLGLAQFCGTSPEAFKTPLHMMWPLVCATAFHHLRVQHPMCCQSLMLLLSCLPHCNAHSVAIFLLFAYV